jgi:hypothetical protein
VTNRTWLEVERDKARARTDSAIENMENTYGDRLESELKSYRLATIKAGENTRCPSIGDLAGFLIDTGEQLAELGALLVDERKHADDLIAAARKDIP